jgi:HlyD family secretion protein
MINNRAHLVFLVIIAVSACGGARAGAPDPLQGVVEYEDRVLGFEVGGRVLALPVQRGQEVAADQLVARLDDTLEKPLRDLRAAELAGAEAQLRLLRAGTRAEELRAAEAEISALRSTESMLDKNLSRQQALMEQNALAQSVLDDTSSQRQSTIERRRALEERLQALRSGPRGDEIAAAVARVQAAGASLAAEEAKLSRYELHAPAAGSVLDRHVEVGELVVPGTPTLSIADLSQPYVDVFVPQSRTHELKVGQNMQVRIDGLAGLLPGRIEHIFSNTEFTPRYLFSESERPNLVVRTRVRVDDRDHRLHAGVPAFVMPAGRTPAQAGES